MKNYYLFWAIGPDRTGIVTKVAKIIFDNDGNIEDSSMMRLGSEFGILLIFTAHKSIPFSSFQPLKKMCNLTLGVNPISPHLASFQPLKKLSAMVTVHGSDRKGLVYHVTNLLSAQKFNITDLSTHRTKLKNKAGYVLFIEGELSSKKSFHTLQAKLDALSRLLDVRISLQLLNPTSL